MEYSRQIWQMFVCLKTPDFKSVGQNKSDVMKYIVTTGFI